jgi:hypothetical protein
MNALSRRKGLLTASCLTLALLPSAGFTQSGTLPTSAPQPALICGSDGGRLCGRVQARSQLDRQSVQINQEGAGIAPVLPLGFAISIDGKTLGQVVESATNQADLARAGDIALGAARFGMQVDPLVSEPILNIVALHDGIVPGQAITFDTYTNYSTFIARSEVRLYAGAKISTDSMPIVVLPVTAGQQVSWTSAGSAGDSILAVLRVYDKDGRYDETASRSVTLSLAPPAAQPGHVPAGADVLADNTLAIRNIIVRGGTVTVRATLVPLDAKLTLGRAIGRVDPLGNGFVQSILPPGDHSEVVALNYPNLAVTSVWRTISIPDHDRFTFAVVDLTVGRRALRGNVDSYLSPETRADRSIFDGRLAIYHKQLLANGTRITIAADTRERPIKELFSGFFERDARGVLRRIDPNLSWPVFGDDSVTIDDAPTSGRFYARAERDTSHVMWGDFQTQLTGTDLANYSRALYGAEFGARTKAFTSFGEARVSINGFVADPGTVGARDEFRATGGSVFFLRRQDVSQGSERLFVEVRDRASGLVKGRRELIPARDYDINTLQGRVFLRAPLASVESDTLYVRDGGLSGDPVYLVATYEYVPGLVQPSDITAGGRATYWGNDHVRFGATAYRQGGDDTDQTLLSGDILFRWTADSNARIEIASSDGGGGLTTRSGTGGFDFNTITAPSREAFAGRVEANLSLKDVNPKAEGRVSAYWQSRELGYAGPGQLADRESLDHYGLNANVKLSERTIGRAKADVLMGDITDTQTIEAGIEHRFDAGWRASFGARRDNRGAVVQSNSPTLNQTGTRTDAILTIGYRPTDRKNGVAPRRDWDVYGFAQNTLDDSGSRPSNDRYGLGGSIQISPRARASAEISDGDLDLGAKVGLDFNANERQSLYLAYTLAAEYPNAFNTGRLGQLSTGMKVRFNDHVGVFGEGRYLHGSGPTGLTQTYGINLSPGKKWTYQLAYETGQLSDPISGDITRNAISASITLTTEAARLSALIERRADQSTQTGSRQVWAWRVLGSKQWSPGLRTYFKINAATSDDTTDLALQADFTEAVFAAAYRPVRNERLNLLAKYTFLSDLASPVQLGSRGGAINYAQRSNVLALDATYEVNGWLSFGGKAAQRIGELRLGRTGHTPWFSSEATFFAARADFSIVKEWDGLIEARTLNVKEAGSTQSGILVALHRHITDEVRLGIGYNFTDFSDDLTNLRGDSKGAFINLVAAF